MNKSLVAALAFGTLTISAAQAADLGVRRGPPAMVSGPACAAQQFQGFYLGASGGSIYHEAHRQDTDGFLTDNGGWTKNKWGALVGGQAGYNFVTCNTLWGVEIDGSWSSVKNTLRDNFNAPDNNYIESKLNTFATARLRTGLVLDNLLLYVTGGFAAAHFKTTWSDAPDTVTFKEWRYGWTAGFGTEWKWTPNWSLKSEVLYASFADRDRSFVGAGPLTYNVRHSDSVWVSRVGLNYSFGGAPVVARY